LCSSFNELHPNSLSQSEQGIFLPGTGKFSDGTGNFSLEQGISYALLMSNDRTSIFVEVQPWVFERRKVETDYQEGATALIKSGLEARRARDRGGRSGSQRLTGS
jgi:hypothetical protein